MFLIKCAVLYNTINCRTPPSRKTKFEFYQNMPKPNKASKSDKKSVIFLTHLFVAWQKSYKFFFYESNLKTSKVKPKSVMFLADCMNLWMVCQQFLCFRKERKQKKANRKFPSKYMKARLVVSSKSLAPTREKCRRDKYFGGIKKKRGNWAGVKKVLSAPEGRAFFVQKFRERELGSPDCFPNQICLRPHQWVTTSGNVWSEHFQLKCKAIKRKKSSASKENPGKSFEI